MCARDFVAAGDGNGPPTRRAQLRAKMAAIRDRTSPPQKEVLQDADVLAVVTAHHKNAVDLAYDVVARIRAIRFVSVLLRTTQLAHVVMALTVVCVLSMFAHNEHSLTRPSTITNAIYLTGFSAHLGAQFWMTFVSGLSLYFSLPRHAFGEVQKVLFPKYFLINSILSASTLVTFGRLNQALVWDMAKGVQVCALGICFLLELAVYLYAVPPLIVLINMKMALESKVPGVGQEVGRHDPGPLRNCPHYVAIHKQFRATHLTVAIANITAMACTAIHMHYLAQHYLSCH